MSVTRVVSIVWVHSLIDRSLNIIHNNDQSTTLSVKGVFSIMSVVSVARGLYLIDRYLELIIVVNNTSFSDIRVMSVTSVVSGVRGLYSSI